MTWEQYWDEENCSYYWYNTTVSVIYSTQSIPFLLANNIFATLYFFWKTNNRLERVNGIILPLQQMIMDYYQRSHMMAAHMQKSWSSVMSVLWIHRTSKRDGKQPQHTQSTSIK